VTVATETAVRMGQLAASSEDGDTLVTIGLGSCIGLVLVDRARGVAGLAHVMLPSAAAHAAGERPAGDAAGKYADWAVPALLERVLALGATKLSLEAALVGGAHMFSLAGGSGTLDVGARNEAAVRDRLAAERIAVKAAATSGSKGRTVRVQVAGGLVVVREAAGRDEVLLGKA
jgi:chemotaxis protein CheD